MRHPCRFAAVVLVLWGIQNCRAAAPQCSKFATRVGNKCWIIDPKGCQPDQECWLVCTEPLTTPGGGPAVKGIGTPSQTRHPRSHLRVTRAGAEMSKRAGPNPQGFSLNEDALDQFLPGLTPSSAGGYGLPFRQVGGKNCPWQIPFLGAGSSQGVDCPGDWVPDPRGICLPPNAEGVVDVTPWIHELLDVEKDIEQLAAIRKILTAAGSGLLIAGVAGMFLFPPVGIGALVTAGALLGTAMVLESKIQAKADLIHKRYAQRELADSIRCSVAILPCRPRHEQENWGQLAESLSVVERNHIVDGIVSRIQAPEGVSEEALSRSRDVIREMLSHMDPLSLQKMGKMDISVIIIPMNKNLTDLESFRDLAGKETFDGRQWDSIRGMTRDVSDWDAEGYYVPNIQVAIPEEDLMVPPESFQPDMAVHEFGHAVDFTTRERERPFHEVLFTNILDFMGLGKRSGLVQDYHRDLFKQRSHATGEPFVSDYASSNQGEYFAECAQVYFGLGFVVGQEASGGRGPEWLRKNDPNMYAELQRIYGPPRDISQFYKGMRSPTLSEIQQLLTEPFLKKGPTIRNSSTRTD